MASGAKAGLYTKTICWRYCQCVSQKSWHLHKKLFSSTSSCAMSLMDIFSDWCPLTKVFDTYIIHKLHQVALLFLWWHPDLIKLHQIQWEGCLFTLVSVLFFFPIFICLSSLLVKKGEVSSHAAGSGMKAARQLSRSVSNTQCEGGLLASETTRFMLCLPADLTQLVNNPYNLLVTTSSAIATVDAHFTVTALAVMEVRRIAPVCSIFQKPGWEWEINGTQ